LCGESIIEPIEDKNSVFSGQEYQITMNCFKSKNIMHCKLMSLQKAVLGEDSNDMSTIGGQFINFNGPFTAEYYENIDENNTMITTEYKNSKCNKVSGYFYNISSGGNQGVFGYSLDAISEEQILLKKY
jgi:hypothetical protein